jgi:hypothetical protein
VKALLALGAAIAAVVSLATSVAPASRARAGADCSLTSTGLPPLTDMQQRRYHGFRGGLYPNGLNRPPKAYLKKGIAASRRVRPINGKIVLLSVGMSNASAEFITFKRIVDRDPTKNSDVVVVNGAQDGYDAKRVRNQPAYWDTVDQRLIAAGVSAEQVQVIWLKEAIAGESRRFPRDARALQADLRVIIRTAKARYPNLRIVYLSSRTYGGYAVTGLNPEPAAYDSGYAVRGVVQDRIKGKLTGPWVAWGPYLWTDGLAGRSDGLVWTCDDVAEDGTHPSASGSLKVANLLSNFFRSDPTAKRWFVSRPG